MALKTFTLHRQPPVRRLVHAPDGRPVALRWFEGRLALSLDQIHWETVPTLPPSGNSRAPLLALQDAVESGAVDARRPITIHWSGTSWVPTHQPTETSWDFK